MGLYFAVLIFGDKFGLPSAGTRFFGVKKPSEVLTSGSQWCGIFLCMILMDSFYVCFKCSEGARARYCNVALMCSLQRFILQVAHASPSVRTISLGTSAEYYPGIISSIVFIALYSSVSSTARLPAGNVWYKPATTTAKTIFCVTILLHGFLAQMIATDFFSTATKVKGKRTAQEYAQLDWVTVMFCGVILNLFFCLQFLTENEQIGFAKARVIGCFCILYQTYAEKAITPCATYKQSQTITSVITVLMIFAAHNRDIKKKLKMA